MAALLVWMVGSAFANPYVVDSTDDSFVIHDTATGAAVVQVTRWPQRGTYELVAELEAPAGCRLHLEPTIIENSGCTARYSHINLSYVRMPVYATITLTVTDAPDERPLLTVTKRRCHQLRFVLDADGDGVAEITGDTALHW